MNFTTKTILSTVAISASLCVTGCGNVEEAENLQGVKAENAVEAVGKAIEAETNVVDEVEVEGMAEDAADAFAEAMAEEPEVTFKEDEVLFEAYGKTFTYADAVKMMKRAMQAQGATEEQAEALIAQMAGRAIPQIAEQMIVTLAIKDAATKAGIKCEESDVASAISNITSRLEGKTLDAYIEEVGADKEEMMKELREGILINKLFEQLTQGCEASEKEIKAFYDENPEYFEKEESVRASHILIKVDDMTDEAAKNLAKEKAAELLKKVREGADFAALAKENSDCPSSAKGGDLGFFGKGQMVKPFEDVAFGLETNQVSDLVETRFGWHIIKTTERNDGGKDAFEDVQEQISQYLKQQKAGEIVSDYVDSIKAKIEYKANDKLKLFVQEEEAEVEPVVKEAEVVEEVVEEAAPSAEVKAEDAPETNAVSGNGEAK